MTQAQSHWRTAESPAARRRPGPGRRSRLEKTPSPRQAGLDFEKWPNRLTFLSESIVTVSVFLVPRPGSWPGPGRHSPGPGSYWQFQVYRLVLVAPATVARLLAHWYSHDSRHGSERHSLAAGPRDVGRASCPGPQAGPAEPGEARFELLWQFPKDWTAGKQKLRYFLSCRSKIIK